MKRLLPFICLKSLFYSMLLFTKITHRIELIKMTTINNNGKSLRNNAILSVIKQLFSILFPIITFPYITRVLGVENYGKYTFSVSIVNYISYIAAAGILRYAIRECARVRDDREKFQKLVNDIFTINVFTTIIAFSALLLLFLLIPELKDYIPYILIISLSVLFTTIGVDWINSAYEDYLFITVRYIFTQFLSMILLFLLVNSANDLMMYSFISVFGGIVANIFNVIHIKRTLGYYPKIIISNSIKKHFKSILYLFASTIATVIYINSDISILKIFSDDQSIAYYGVSTQFYQLIKQLINAAFLVVIPRFSNDLVKKNKTQVTKSYNTILSLTILVIFPSAIGLFMIRENLILLFSGKLYLPAANSLAILSFSLIPAMLANFFINIIMVPLRLEKQVMFATVSSALFNIIFNFILIPKYSESGAAVTTLFAEIIMVLIALYFCRDLRVTIPIKVIVTSLIGGIGIFLICDFFNNFDFSSFTNILLSISFSIGYYLFVIFIGFRSDLTSIFRK